MADPERIAREKIDALLVSAGWEIQDREQLDRNAALGVAVREFPLPAGSCDYLLLVGGKAAGVIEAKKFGATLSGVAVQMDKYLAALPMIRILDPTPHPSQCSCGARCSQVLTISEPPPSGGGIAYPNLFLGATGG